MSSNRSGIPVRNEKNAAHQTRNATSHHKKENGSTRPSGYAFMSSISKGANPADEPKKISMNAKQANSRLPPRRNSERELKEENSSLKEEAKNYVKNIQRLETCLKESEEKTETMDKDMISLEATHMRVREEQDRRNLFLESKAESYEKKLLLCNIDPVTLMNLDPGDGDEMQKKIEVVKHKKKLLNEKLKKMNEEYVSHIDEIKVMTDSLEKIKENLPVPVYTDARDAEDNMKHKSP